MSSSERLRAGSLMPLTVLRSSSSRAAEPRPAITAALPLHQRATSAHSPGGASTKALRSRMDLRAEIQTVEIAVQKRPAELRGQGSQIGFEVGERFPTIRACAEQIGP